jgi:PAS domain S-box-containing protein
VEKTRSSASKNSSRRRSEASKKSVANVLASAAQSARTKMVTEASEHRLRQVLDNLFAFVGLLTPEGTVIETNRAPLDAAGIDLADVQGRRFEDCYWWSYSAEVQAQLREAIKRAAQGETARYDVEIRVTGGFLITIDFMLAPLRDEVGSIIGLIPSAVDITERKRLTNERFQAFLDVAPDALILVRSDCTIRSVNVQAERLFGYVRGEIIGQPIELLMPERYRQPHLEHQENYFANPLRRPMHTGLEIYGLIKDGREIPLEISLSPMATPEGTMALAAVRDITERTQAERALRSAKEAADTANRLKSRFVAAASHDLRQPLQTIGLLGGVLAQTAKDEASRSAVKQLRDMVAAMGDIVGSLLDIDRLDTGRMVPEIVTFPIERLLDRMRSQFGYLAAERGIELSTVSSSAFVLSDLRLLERLIGNLVSNAIKYTDAGGRVLVGCRRRGGNLRFEVWDTGVGIPEDQLENVFDEYHRLAPTGGRPRAPGFGLGLALVKRLSEILEHQIEVLSEPGRGTVFAVELPLAQADPGRGAPLTAMFGEAVLIVEDETGPRESLRLLLELNGYEVRAVATAREALDLQDCPSPPRLVIADNCLGENMTGLEMIKGLRVATGRDFPAIVLTGDSSPETRREVESAGCRHEVKPIKFPAVSGLDRFVVLVPSDREAN